MRFFIFLSIFFFCSFFSSSQDYSNEKSPEQSIDGYFKIPRESLYLHLNKSTYVFGEEIWFKGYAYDQHNLLPSQNTKNFNVELFDYQSKRVYKGLFRGNQGSTKGNIKIDSTWTSGNYYLRISTSWMNNFIEDDSYTQKITILNKEKTTEIKKEKITYDFQILPEGGHIISDTDNSIGYKLINNQGYGVAFNTGYVIDDFGNKLRSFTSNHLGIGKFNIHPKPGVTYKAVVKLRNGKEVTTDFPKVHTKGIVLSINNLFEDQIAIELNTNKITLSELESDEYYILIHQNNGFIKVAFNFLFNQTKKNIFIDRKKIFKGVNTITLFKGNRPVAERMFYNPSESLLNTINVNYVNTPKDSLLFNLETKPKDKVNYDISVSVLPEETKSYNHQDNIISSLLLTPYVKGYIEDARYYFTDIDRTKVYDLDLLLITQGWSKYDWNTIFKTKPKPIYDFESGITIKGKLQSNKYKDLNKMYIFPSKHHLGRMLDLDKKNDSFILTNYFLEKGEEIRFSGVRSNGNFVKPLVYFQTQTNTFIKPFKYNIPLETRLADDEDILVMNDVRVPKDFLSDKTVFLEKVVVKGTIDKEEELNDGFISDNIKRNSKKITVKDTQDFPNILDYIATKGFRIRYSTGKLDQPIVSILPQRAVTVNGSGPSVYIDDVRISDFDVLFNLQTADIDRVLVDRFGSVSALSGSGTIFIYTRRIPLEGSEAKNNTNVSTHKITKGFEATKTYYNPQYKNYLDPFFVNYGTIHWEPKIKFNKKGIGVFKIPDTGLENITFYIEGMGSDGSLFSERHTIKNINLK